MGNPFAQAFRMERFVEEIPAVYLILSGAIGLCFTLVVQLYLRRDNLSYSIPVPEQCSASWEGKILDDPSIKVN